MILGARGAWEAASDTGQGLGKLHASNPTGASAEPGWAPGVKDHCPRDPGREPKWESSPPGEAARGGEPATHCCARPPRPRWARATATSPCKLPGGPLLQSLHHHGGRPPVRTTHNGGTVGRGHGARPKVRSANEAANLEGVQALKLCLPCQSRGQSSPPSPQGPS